MGGGEQITPLGDLRLDVGGAGRVQRVGGLGRQLGDGACMALAKRSGL